MTSPYERRLSVQTLVEGKGVSMSPAICGVQQIAPRESTTF